MEHITQQPPAQWRHPPTYVYHTIMALPCYQMRFLLLMDGDGGVVGAGGDDGAGVGGVHVWCIVAVSVCCAIWFLITWACV